MPCVTSYKVGHVYIPLTASLSVTKRKKNLEIERGRCLQQQTAKQPPHSCLDVFSLLLLRLYLHAVLKGMAQHMAYQPGKHQTAVLVFHHMLMPHGKLYSQAIQRG